jgi:hypothetical protein
VYTSVASVQQLILSTNQFIGQRPARNHSRNIPYKKIRNSTPIAESKILVVGLSAW